MRLPPRGLWGSGTLTKLTVTLHEALSGLEILGELGPRLRGFGVGFADAAWTLQGYQVWGLSGLGSIGFRVYGV